MLGSLGFPELLFILVLALLIFGPRKLPEIGRTLGRALGEFRRATSDLKRSIDVEMAEAEPRPAQSPAARVTSPKPDAAAATAPVARLPAADETRTPPPEEEPSDPDSSSG